MSAYYHITIQGHLDQQRSAWFADLTITNKANGVAVLAGPLVDQAALYGVLMRLRDLGLRLIAVQLTEVHSACSIAPESHESYQ